MHRPHINKPLPLILTFSISKEMVSWVQATLLSVGSLWLASDTLCGPKPASHLSFKAITTHRQHLLTSLGHS